MTSRSLYKNHQNVNIARKIKKYFFPVSKLTENCKSSYHFELPAPLVKVPCVLPSPCKLDGMLKPERMHCA
jgi:hypothetical protein